MGRAGWLHAGKNGETMSEPTRAMIESRTDFQNAVRGAFAEAALVGCARSGWSTTTSPTGCSASAPWSTT